MRKVDEGLRSGLVFGGTRDVLSFTGSFALDLIFIPSLSHLGVLHHFGRR